MFQRLASSLGSLNTVSGTAALRAGCVQLLRCVTRSDSLIPSRTARLMARYAIHSDSAVMPTSTAIQSTNPNAGISDPPSAADSAIERRAHLLALRDANASSWREVAEFLTDGHLETLGLRRV